MGNNSSRTSNSIKNSLTSMGVYMINIIIGFVTQSIFIRNLGAEYNGIKGLFMNILSMLSVAELGFGSAIVYNLYKPVAEKNVEEVRTLVKFYRNVYHIVAGVIFVIGLILLPFIPNVVGEVTIPEDVRLLFFLYLISTVASYLITYKRSILYADQKSYITSGISSVFLVLSNVVQILIIIFTKNFVIYLVAQIAFAIVENIVTNLVIDRKYEYIRNLENVKPVSQQVKRDIITKVKGLLFHKIGEFIVLGTDNIIISMTPGLGVIMVGMYANYNMIIMRVKNLFSSVFASLTASVGNLLVEKNKEKSRKIYQSMLLINSWLFCFAAISIYCMIEPFVRIWIGDGYLLSQFVLIVLMVNLYIGGLRFTNNTFKNAAGIFYEDRFIPIVESITNLVVSLILAKIFGLAGIFLGTITSTMILFLYSFPKYIYRLVLEGSYGEYFKLYAKHGLITIVICVITAYISSLINTSNNWLQLFFNGIVCVVVPNVLYFLFAMRMAEFDFYKEKLKYMKTRIRR